MLASDASNIPDAISSTSVGVSGWMEGGGVRPAPGSLRDANISLDLCAGAWGRSKNQSNTLGTVRQGLRGCSMLVSADTHADVILVAFHSFYIHSRRISRCSKDLNFSTAATDSPRITSLTGIIYDPRHTIKFTQTQISSSISQ